MNEIDLQVKSPNSLIVSWEALSGSISPQKPPDFNCKRLIENLSYIQTSAPSAGIIIGFREHQSWLQAAFSQKAKHKQHIDRQTYVKTFSRQDLSWCTKLQTIEASFTSVFPFLYEEIIQSPMTLIGDLCHFIGKAPPSNLHQLLRDRRNLSPRSSSGQFVARSIRTVFPAHRGWMQLSQQIGTWLDRFAPTNEAVIDARLSSDLQDDWIRLLDLVSKSRGRDLTDFAARNLS